MPQLAFVSFPLHSRKACFSQKKNDGANEFSALAAVLAESLLSAKEERQRSDTQLAERRLPVSIRKNPDFSGRGGAAERMSFRPWPEANDTELAPTQ